MAHLKQYAYPGVGEWAAENFHYSQAVRVGDRIVCSGQGGWDPSKKDVDFDNMFPESIEQEIAQAFANVDHSIKHAGGKGFSQVFRITTYSTDIPSQHEFIVANYRKWMPGHRPTWTEIGVKQLGAPGMRFEIEVEAHDPEGDAK